MINESYFDGLYNTLLNQAEKYTFNLKDLPHVNDYLNGIRHLDKFHNMFKELDSKTNSCLYWFQLSDEESCGKIVQLLDNSREFLKENVRIVPVKNSNCNSKTLYVGSRRGGYTKKWELSNISGRIIQHLGFYKVGSTQGLQLVHWAGQAEHDITLNIYEFEKDFPNQYLGAIEKIMAHKLLPLCGKH